MIQKALILAAGKGTRLKPLTDTCPKALLEFKGKPMLEHVINQVVSNGIRNIVINVHHHADRILEFIRSRNYSGIEIVFSDERDMLMDTGGAIIKARNFLETKEPFLVHNVDIFSSLDVQEMLTLHEEEEAVATLAVRHRETSRNLLIDEDGYLGGWQNNKTGEKILLRDNTGLEEVAFSGIHILDSRIFELINRSDPFSITDAYLELAKKFKILTYTHDEDIWIDMARPDQYGL